MESTTIKILKNRRTKIFSTGKCDMQRLSTSNKYSLFVCGDMELNPGPVPCPFSILTTRLNQMGLRPVNIVGDGNCFFRSVSHQIYQTETCHAQIHALAVQHLINCPEHFIESNTEQSWVQFLQNISRQGTSADYIIQAVANSHNLRIHITESAQNFAEQTVVNSIYDSEPRRNACRDIHIGHLDEMHYVSTTPICTSQAVSDTTDTTGMVAKSVISHNVKSRKEYMREYMRQRRMNTEFKAKENERKKVYNKKYKQSNPEKVTETQRKASASYQQSNPTKHKETLRKAKALYRQENLEKVKVSGQKYRSSYKKLHKEQVKTSSKLSNVKYRQTKLESYRLSQKKQYAKRKLAKSETELVVKKQKKHERNSEPQTTVEESIETFHKNISVGPKYICSCSEQLWYKSSVTKCNCSLYKFCSKEIVDLCITGLKSINETEGLCATCHSNLKSGKFPKCAKANKMSFPKKPDALKNLTPLEERLILPRIPFMQVRELPSGGQLSIHGNVVNVPADVNSTVNVLPGPINESQTIPIK